MSGEKFSRLKACTRPAALTIHNPRAHRSKDLVWPGGKQARTGSGLEEGQ